jgi:tetratricopeptide (TPR) repeat protein
VNSGHGWSAVPVARYLRPEERVVPFRMRPELPDILRWCRGGGRVAVRLVTGLGGAGKTRLALQVCQEMATDGWLQLWVPQGREIETAAAIRELNRACVVIVDYAENRRSLEKMLNGIVGNIGGPTVRVILLARGSGEWWRRFVTSTDENVARLLTSPPMTLGAIWAEGGPEELFRDAARAFSAKLQVVCPEVRFRMTDSAPVVLAVHTAALLSVLDRMEGGDREARSWADVVEGLLNHEARYWAKSAIARGLNLDTAVQRRAVASGSLIGADTEIAAMTLMSCIPDLADSAELRGRVARWLHDLYPDSSIDQASSHEWIAPLRPDAVAEQLIISELSGQPELITGLFKGLNEDRAVRALTVLARAARVDSRAPDLLSAALATDLEHLAVPAMSVAIETNSLMGNLLNEAIISQSVSVNTAERIARTAPYPSLSLAQTCATVLELLIERSTDESHHALWLYGLSNRLEELGRPDSALSAVGEASRIYRDLARERPDEFLPNLAKSLNNKSNRLADMGHLDEALTAAQEASRIYRDLATDRPEEFLPGLTVCLNTQSIGLSSLGRQEEALAVIEEALEILRGLARNSPEEFLQDLATILNNKANRLTDLGRRGDALAAIEEAVNIYRDLTRTRSDMFRPDLATALSNQSEFLFNLGRSEEAISVIEESLAIRRDLARDRPAAFLPALATALNNHSVQLSGIGREEEALSASETATRIYREVVRDRPGAFKPYLATSLNNQSVRLANLDRAEEALVVIEEAVTIFRDFVRNHPDAFLPDLAMSLHNQGCRLADLNRLDEALTTNEQAIQIFRGIARNSPDAVAASLAECLSLKSKCLVALGRSEEALPITEEAVALRRGLARSLPDVFKPDFSKSLEQLANLLSELGHITETARVRAELEDMAGG